MDFLSLTLQHWEDMWSDRHQIMSFLGREHKCLFVSYPFRLDQVLTNFKTKSLPESGILNRENSLYTLVFPKWIFLTPGHPWISQMFKLLMRLYVRGALKRLGFQDIVLIVWNPCFAESLGWFGEAISCYYVDDQFTGYAGITEAEAQSIRRQEDFLLRNVDLVFANGVALLEDKNKYGNAINVPMAADFGLYSRSRLPETLVPEDLDGIPHPRIAHIGNINEKIDLALLRQLAVARPSWSFIVIGPVNLRTEESRREFELLKSQPNFFSLGFKPRELLPNYIKGLDVCLLCYRLEGWARYIYPLKLHEYLASGKPVVGPRLRSLLEFKDVCKIAQSTEQWLRGIEEALEETDRALAEKRVQVAYENRLEERIQVIKNAVEQKLNEKKNAGRAVPDTEGAEVPNT
jgi:glycosyltransferase involved in cell wall biosynthesis